ncbi:MAG: hypothetical protein ABJG88_00290 [Litorimonas sp.]
MGKAEENTPKTKNWFAYCNTQPGNAENFYVIGQVETNASNLIPKLRKAHQGLNTKILILELTIVDISTPGTVGTPSVAFRPARYDQETCINDQEKIETVSIIVPGDGDIIDIKVEEIS